MAKKENKQVDYEDPGFTVDDTVEIKQVPIEKTYNEVEQPVQHNDRTPINSEPLINCLRHERVIVRHISKQSGIITDPKNPFYGGMGENCFREFVVPRLRSGLYVDVLTKDEMRYLEYVMNLAH